MTRDHAAPPTATQAASADDCLAAATRAHEAGRLDEAKALYLEAIALNPYKPEAEHGLGWLQVQLGDWRGALPRFARTIQLRPWEPEFWISQLEALFQAGQHEAVHRLLHRARMAGLSQDAIDGFDARLRDARMQALTAQVRRSGKSAQRAAEAPQAALLAMRESFRSRRFAEAQARAAAVVRDHPLSAFAWRVLGASAAAFDRSDQAIEALRIACDLDPGNVDVSMNLALALHERGRGDEAERLYAGVLAQAPDNVRALVNRGLLLNSRRDPAAETLLRRARELGSDDHRVALALGAYLRDHDRHEEAAPLLEEALAKEPDNQAAIAALCVCCIGTGRHAQADALFRRLRASEARDLGALGIALFAATHLASVSAEDLYALHRHYGAILEAGVEAVAHHDNDRDPMRRLRVGFVSGDLRRHALASFLHPIWERLDREAIEVIAYSNHTQQDATTAALRAVTDGWRDIAGLSDEVAADRIRKDAIDVLVDLSGHTAFHRLGLFARRPAPVQISWAGYPATTGLSRMDYYLTDTALVPPGRFDAQFSEALLLTEAGCAFDGGADAPDVAALPASTGAPFTFGSFNRLSKLTPETLDLWSRVLDAAPDARMCVGSVAEAEAPRLRAAFATRGIDASRIDFLPRMGTRDYLDAHAKVDLLLDTRPYSGGTTTCHGLWMGVPTLTLTGPTAPSRQSASCLLRVGLAGFVMEDEATFVAAALAWRSALPALAALRAELRGRVMASGLGHPHLAAEAFDDAVRAAWRRWCAGASPAPIVVPLRTVAPR